MPAVDSTDLRRQLLEMPKAPVDDLVVSTGVQARWACLAALIFPALAAVFFLLSLNPLQEKLWRHWAFAMLAIYITPGLISLFVLIWAWAFARPVKTMARGWYYVRWIIPPEQWKRECNRISGQNRNLALIVFGVIFFAGLSFAGIAFGEGDVFFGGTFAHFTIIGVASALIGLVLGVFVHWLGNMTGRLTRQHTPQVLIGREGIYLTGRFWPAEAPAQTLESIQFHESEPQCLIARFRVTTQHGPRTSELIVPFPEERRQEAEEIVRILNRTG